MKMKSKSFDLKRSSSEKVKQNKTFDFTSYYKSAAETKTVIENTKGPAENINKENKFSKNKNGTPSRADRTPNKKKNKLELLDISRIDIEGPTLDSSVANNTPFNESKLTSTPQTSGKGELKVKSIMKNKSATNSDDNNSTYSPKPKKRNKSVSFMLDDADEVVVKKTKSNESIGKKSESPKKASKEFTKAKKNKMAKTDKENKINGNVNSEIAPVGKSKKSEKAVAKEVAMENAGDVPNDKPVPSKEEKVVNKKSKVKKFKKRNSEDSMDTNNESNNNEDQTENKNRKPRKKKHSARTQQSPESGEADGEPAAKAQKKEGKPEAIVEDLESLSIGDNAHTLTNLLDEMTVVDKKKKNKQKVKKDKKPVSSTTSTESADLEKIEEGKEKIKWKKRKWNKDKKGDVEEDVTATSVIVDNLPLSMVCSYKKQLADQFGKHGQIKKIGVAEVYPAEESKPVFTTTIQFNSEAAAIEALEEDSSEVCGQVIRVRRPLPATETTLVVRSYGELTDQTVSSAFAEAGRIRSIRHLVKGRKAIATAFVEFDGPEPVSRALRLAAAARAAGKRLHAARFLPRPPPARDSEGEH